MLIGCIAILMSAATTFLTDVPDRMREKLLATNETAGTFVQTKRLPTGETFTARGSFRIRPSRDFEWHITDPFDALFKTTQTHYCYSNEDECVTKPLAELHGFSHLATLENGDFSSFFKMFDARYIENNEFFHLRARPKDTRLQHVLACVDADGTLTNWTLRATFPNDTCLDIELLETPREKK